MNVSLDKSILAQNGWNKYKMRVLLVAHSLFHIYVTHKIVTFSLMLYPGFRINNFKLSSKFMKIQNFSLRTIVSHESAPALKSLLIDFLLFEHWLSTLSSWQWTRWFSDDWSKNQLNFNSICRKYMQDTCTYVCRHKGRETVNLSFIG